jgi:adenosylcobyric acid synthase
MLGRRVADPLGLEGPASVVDGLGHLDIDTEMAPLKQLALRTGRQIPTGVAVEGYEIHMGQTDGPDCSRAWLDMGQGPTGATNSSGRVMGCYLHGIFANDAFRAMFLDTIGATSALHYDHMIDDTLDNLAAHLEMHLDLDQLWSISAQKTP